MLLRQVHREPFEGFNSRARKGRDKEATELFYFLESFNSRARKGRDKNEINIALTFEGFNSRARKGRDIVIGQGKALYTVSIHAPARGATSLNVKIKMTKLFQFTRPQGARQRSQEQIL